MYLLTGSALDVFVTQICVVTNLLFIQMKDISIMIKTTAVRIPIFLWNRQQKAIIAMDEQEKTITNTTKFHEILLNTPPFPGAVY